MKMKLNMYILLLFIVISNLLIAGCGGCQINNDLSEKTSSSTFIDTVPNDGKIDGFVIASCNKCNLGNISDRKCSMGIKVNNEIFSVYGYSQNHDAAHKIDGICNALRVAYVSGKISYKTLYPDTFELINKPN